MHAKIIKAFKNYHLFGFTGTPIFAANAGKGKHMELLTTPQTFGDQLHTYTIVDAINELSGCNRILIFTDIGSSIMSSEIALDLVDEDLKEKCILVDAPIVEGAFVAGVQSMVSDDVDAVLEEVQLTKLSKF